MPFSQMFPSSHNNNVYCKPFFVNDIITSTTTTTTNTNTNTTSNYYGQSSFFSHLPPSSPNFSNPCCYDDLFDNQNGEFSLHHHPHHDQEEEPQQQELKECSEILLLENINNIFNFNNNNNTEDHHLPESMNKKEVVIRKRCSKRDRHSKINTAQGPRDRRMRLSLKVARDFFDLQDKLSFDKASKTVEWLLLQARSAIMKLSGTTTITTTTSANVVVVVNQSASSTSECEVVSGIEDEAAVIKDNNNNKVSKGKTNKVKKAKTCPRKASFHPQANKESRVRARAKARERTRKKIDEQLRELEEANNYKNNINGGFNQLSCDWRRIEESAATHQNINPCISEVLKAPTITSPLATSESITQESWAARKWSPFPSLTHLCNSEFPQEQNQITDFQHCANQYGSHCDIVARQY